MAEVAILGAGPAGLAAYNLLQKCGVKADLFESGPDLEERLQTCPLLNGKGGAGLWSDRKVSAGTAGTGLLHTNPYLLRHSYSSVLRQMACVLPNQFSNVMELLNKTLSFLGDQTVSSEELDRRVADFLSQQSKQFAKLYPSLVLSDFNSAKALINMCPTPGAKFNTKVVNLERVGSRYLLTYLTDQPTQHLYDYVILAMGRFGSVTCQKFTLFQEMPVCQPVRLEIGVRVNIEMYPPLEKALLKMRSDPNMIADPKLKLQRAFMIDGNLVPCEFRSFCVCLPLSGSGYVVQTEDCNSGFTTWSGSSSVQELAERKEVYEGSNLGIMMRITDPAVITKYSSSLVKKFDCQRQIVCGVEDTMTVLQLYYSTELCYPLYSGLMEMLFNICGEAVEKPLTLYAPCVEGVGLYPKVDQSTYQLVTEPQLFVAGDMVGHTRGLLQSMVMGNLVGEAVMTHSLEKYLKAANILQDYQSIFLPSFSYNKTLVSSHQNCQHWTGLYCCLSSLFISHLQTEPLDQARYNEIYNSLHRVYFTGDSPTVDVVYELHHFFLDAEVYGKQQQLHYISQHAMLQYILLCNVVDRGLKELEAALCRLLGLSDLDIKTHQFKSCVLALRTRASLEDRERFHDIPVMQSAFKLMYKADTETQLKVVATLCTLLDSFFKKAIHYSNLDLLLVRSKIETQEPAVDSDSDPLYLECHVKVNVTQADGSLVDYTTKKKCIQELASLFEGSNAVVQGIFKVMSVSINLLKHPTHGQQFFLTYRTNSKKEMEFIRKKWKLIMERSLQLLPQSSILRKYMFTFFPDAEFVIYDDNRALDKPWFPVTQDFLCDNYLQAVADLCSSKLLLVVSDNAAKVKEISSFLLLKTACIRVSVPMSDSACLSLQESATEKALAGYAMYQRPVLAESTGLYIDGTTNYPGAQTKLVLKHIGDDNLIRLAQDRQVTAVTVVAYHDGQQVHLFQGSLQGRLQSPQPDYALGGFGWDNLFYPEGSLVPLSALPASDKKMRCDALSQLFNFL